MSARPDRSYALHAYLLVASGGAIGALARHGVTLAFTDIPGTFIANITGAFLLGFVGSVAAIRVAMSTEMRRFIGVGILGSYTTFSTLSYQTYDLLEQGDWLLALGYAGASFIAGLVAVMAGVRLARR